jgi:hypothetical protein
MRLIKLRKNFPNPLDTRLQMPYTSQVINQTQMQDEYLSRCVVDPLKRTVYLYSNDGNEKQVTCETVEQFMNVLDFVRATVDEETLSYANPL